MVVCSDTLLTVGDDVAIVQTVVNEPVLPSLASSELIKRVQSSVPMGDSTLLKVQVGPTSTVTVLPTGCSIPTPS